MTASRSPIFTTTPETPAPRLPCPLCERPLQYEQTVIGGVAPLERWDYLKCSSCGSFEYRHRTRMLRPMPGPIMNPWIKPWRVQLCRNGYRLRS